MKAMQKLEVSYKSVSELIPYVNNSRTHSDTQVLQIASSIKEFGFTNPILIDEHGGVIAGHGRIMGAKKLGIDEVPTITLSGLTDAQRKAYVIADNKLALNSGWDEELLKIELQALDEIDFDLSVIGFDEDELSSYLDDNELTEGLTDEDDVPEPPEKPVTREGDVWLLGNHRLMCGDSTSMDAVAKLMDGKLADQLVTDPPYNVAYEGKTADALTIQNDDMNNDDFRQFLVEVYTTADSVLKEGGVFYIWHADSEGYNFRGAMFEVGWQVRQCLIWKKSSMVMGRQDYHWKHEPCLYGWKGGAGHLWASDRKQTTILEFDRPNRNDLHPTMKPIDLIQYCVENNTKINEVVLDLFGGSGSTMIACEITNRHNCSMELDPKYCDVIINRWQDFTGKKATLEIDGRTFEEVSND